MDYKSYADLILAIQRNAHRIPSDIDLIVGIPRSGMLAASVLSLHLNRPLLDVDSFLEGKGGWFGQTVQRMVDMNGDANSGHVLVMDDSIRTGGSMREVRERIEEERPGQKATYCCVYSAKAEHPEVDIAFEVTGLPRFFEWNMLRHRIMNSACFDIDGVLCHDPDKAVNDDGPLYGQFLKDAKSLHLPHVKVGAVVTSRLEKYRVETQDWLKRHGIEYDTLHMLDLATAEERQRLRRHASHKAEFYRKSDYRIFIESEYAQAVEIANLSKKPVLSIQHSTLLEGDTTASLIESLPNSMKSSSTARRWVGALGRKILGQEMYHRIRFGKPLNE